MPNLSARDWVLRVAPLLWGRAWQPRLAAVAGVSRRTVSYWAAGRLSPGALQVERLAAAVRQRRELLSLALGRAPLDPAGEAWARVNAVPVDVSALVADLGDAPQ